MKPITLVLALFASLASLAAQTSELLPPPPKPEMIDLIPTFVVQNIHKSAEFYSQKLGFSVVLQSGNYIAIGRDYVQIGLVPGDKQAKRNSCYIKMSRIDDFYAQLKSVGVKLTTELKTQPSKMREFSVTDLDGNTLVFGEYVGGTAPAVEKAAEKVPPVLPKASN